jgi:hypothetical protein
MRGFCCAAQALKVAIDYQDAVAPQTLGYGGLFLQYCLEVTEPGQVGWMHVCYNRNVGLGDSREAGDLAGTVAADLRKDYLVLRVGAEQRQGQSYIVVEIPGGLRYPEVPAQDVIDNLPRGRFARRAGYSNDLEIHFPAILSCQVAESVNRVFHCEDRTAEGFAGLIDNCAGGASGEGVGHIVMPIEILTGYSKETVTGSNGSRVGADAGERSSEALREIRLYDLSQLFDR